MSSKMKSCDPKQINISLVTQPNQTCSNASIDPSKKTPTEKGEKQDPKEWRESFPIKLEHLLFTFKENSLKVYKAAPSRSMQISALVIALLLFCGILALFLVQKVEISKKNANLPLDQSAVAERIQSDFLSPSNLFKEVAQIVRNNSSRSTLPSIETNSKVFNRTKFELDPKEKQNKKTGFGTFLFSNQDDATDLDDNDQLDNSNELLESERIKTNQNNNFNLFAIETNDKNEENKQQDNENDNSKVILVERLMGMNFGFKPKIGISESLVIQKNLNENAYNNLDETKLNENKEQEINLPMILSKPITQNQVTSLKSTDKQLPNELNGQQQLPFLLRYIVAAMLSRFIAASAAQQQMLHIQQQQKLRELNPHRNEKSFDYLNLPPRTRPTSDENLGQPFSFHHHHAESKLNSIYGLPKHRLLNNYRSFPTFHKNRNLEQENDVQQGHPIVLMLNLPIRESLTTTPAQNTLSLTSSNAINPFLMHINQLSPNSPSNSFLKQTHFLKDQESQIYHTPPLPFASHFTSPQNNPFKSFYRPLIYHSQNQPFNHHTQPQTLNHHYYQKNPLFSRSFSYARPLPESQPSTIEVPIEVHHHHTINPQEHIVSSQLSSQHENTLQLNNNQHHQFSTISDQTLEAHQPESIHQFVSQNYLNPSNENDLSNEGEHHMVVFYDVDLINPGENQLEKSSKQHHLQSIGYRSIKPVNYKEENNSESDNQANKILTFNFVNSPTTSQPNQQSSNQQQQQNSIKPSITTQQPKLHQTNVHQANTQHQIKFGTLNKNSLFEKPIVNKKIVSSFINREEDENTSSGEQEKTFYKKTPLPADPLDKEENSNKLPLKTKQPESFARFAQVIRNVVEQQQQQQQTDLQKQLPYFQSIHSTSDQQQNQKFTLSNSNQASQQQNLSDQPDQPLVTTNSLFNENETLKTEDKTSAQESIQKPALLVVAED